MRFVSYFILKQIPMNDYKLSGNAFEPHATRLYENTNVINVSPTGRSISAAAGALLYLGFARKKGIVPNLMRMGGLYLLYRGLSGNCPLTAMLQKEDTKEHIPSVNIRTSFVVNAPRKLVYDTWRDLERLPKFLKHIDKIKVVDEMHSHWVLKTPGKIPSVEWDAEIIEQIDGRELSWRSLAGSTIETAGKINFADTLNGTELIILITYRPPAGYIGSTIAKLFNNSLKIMVENDLLRFKAYIENKAMSETEIKV